MIPLYIVILIGLFVYSFSQIDLNLTLFTSKIFMDFQNQMILLGYFNRPVSTLIFALITVLLFLCYGRFLSRFPSRRGLVLLLLSLSIVAVFSYPAFSHDIFNYIFDARIAVLHRLNPYTTTALMLPNDTWTRFMQWTHRSYPYGPVFLPITMLVYVLGFGRFVLTLLAFKFMILASFLGICWLVFKRQKSWGLVFFALNPVVIYEGLVAGHLDLVMAFFGVLALEGMYRKKTWSWIALATSVGIKYVTILWLPVTIFWEKISEVRRADLLILLAYLGVAVQIGFRELLPHYFLVPIAVTAFVRGRRIWQLMAIVVSFVLLQVRYLPFLYSGQWFTLKIF